MSREDLARDLWIHCTSRTKQLGLLIYRSLILRRLHFGDYIYIFRRFTTGSPIDGTHWLPNKEMTKLWELYLINLFLLK